VSGAVDVLDLWSEVVGQAAAVRQLQAAVRSPVHAYLLVGPAGSGKRAAARAFAAELLSEGLDAAGVERTRRLAAAEAHPSLFVVEREGESIDAKQADEVVRRSSLAPPEGTRQVIVLLDFHLVTVAGPKLLKSIEEPPPTTFFVILVEELPPEMETIASRCVRVDLSGVPATAIAEWLVADGVDGEAAEAAAGAAGGSLARARLLARDPEVRARRDSWYRAPERLDGTGHAVSVVVDELLEAVEGVLEPLAAQQAEELERFVAGFESAGLPVPKGQLQAIEKRHKREQRKVRMDELRSGLAVLVGRYRDAVGQGGSAEDFVTVADEVQRLCEALTFNPRESLALQALFVSLPRLS
jgi:DNA polymerase III subunit delta'